MAIRINTNKSNAVVLAIACALSFSINDACAREGGSSHARQEALQSQMMQWYRGQSASLSPENAQRMWQSVAQAPRDFPVPIYEGTETLFMQTRLPQCIPGMQNVSQLSLRTKNSLTAVNQWYQSRLSQAGLTIDTAAPKVTTVGYRILKAESEKLTCSIFIYGHETGDLDTTVNITVVKKAT